MSRSRIWPSCQSRRSSWLLSYGMCGRSNRSSQGNTEQVSPSNLCISCRFLISQSLLFNEIIDCLLRHLLLASALYSKRLTLFLLSLQSNSLIHISIYVFLFSSHLIRSLSFYFKARFITERDGFITKRTFIFSPEYIF